MASPVPTPVLAGKKVIIIGAGISGLAFPLALRKQWPAELEADFPCVTIYERDPRETNVDREGYTISIRGDPLGQGMQVLHKMGVLDELLDVSLTGREDCQEGAEGEKGAFCLWDLNWNPLLRLAGVVPDKELPAPAMRIRRDSLRQVLIETSSKIRNVTFNWNTTCRKIETGTTDSNRSVKVHFRRHENDEVDECDLLIVADGANSKIRTQLRPKDVLEFLGIVMISGVARFDDGAVPKPMDKNWGGVIGGGGIGLFVSPVDNQSALWALSYRAEQPRERVSSPIPDGQVQALLQEALDLAKPFHAPLPTLIRATDPSTLMVLNAMDKKPFAHEWGSPVIFIGDSNHAMSPFSGNGANMALCDAWQLVEQLTIATSTHVAVKNYDGLSVPRSSRAINMSHWSISMLHATGFKLLAYKFVMAITRFIQRWKK